MVSLNRDALTEKILEGARISTDDALELYRSPLEECAARFGKGEKLRRTRPRDRDVHRRSQHQLHKRLQRLLQVLRVLSDRTRRRSLRAELRAARSKAGRTQCCRRSANPD